MTVGFLDHKALMIIKGVGKTPGNNNSAENDPVVVNLMSGLITLTSDGWIPEIPQIKNGGVWTDSPINDGRQLLAAPFGNVTEKITILIRDDSYLGTIKALSGLNKMAQDCVDYWQTQVQIDPVYLMWTASCGAGPQFALIYSMQLAPTYLDSDKPTIRVDLSIEREPYWRGIPPGANPKIWTYYVNLAHPNYDINGASLIANSDHLITQTIQNKVEWTPAAYGLQSTFISKNFIDIPASQVPGDAPALVEMAISVDLNAMVDVYVARYSKPQSGIGNDGINRVNSFILNAGDGVPDNVVKTIGAVAYDVKSNGSTVNYYYGSRTVTGIDANYISSIRWGENVATGLIKLDREMFRGTFAIFCRCNNASAAATLADMRIRVVIDEFENNAANEYINTWTGPDVRVPIPVGSVRILTYMGTVTIPFENRAVVSPLGYGIQLQEANSNLRVTLQQKVDVATANRVFEVTDLVFMPLDEALAQMAFTINTSSPTGVALLDNTGYLAHGDINQSTVGYITNANSGGVSQELRGQDITLLPRMNQRLYFIADGWTGLVTSSRASQSLVVRLNIVPRWFGVRDV